MFGHGEVEIPLREEDELLFSIVTGGCVRLGIIFKDVVFCSYNAGSRVFVLR